MPDARDDSPTLGELGRRLDHYALTTGAALDKLEAKIDAMGDTYVSRREYDRDDADHEQVHRDIRAEIADIKKAAVDSRRWAIGTALTVAALVLTTLGLLLNYTG